MSKSNESNPPLHFGNPDRFYDAARATNQAGGRSGFEVGSAPNLLAWVVRELTRGAVVLVLCVAAVAVYAYFG